MVSTSSTPDLSPHLGGFDIFVGAPRLPVTRGRFHQACCPQGALSAALTYFERLGCDGGRDSLAQEYSETFNGHAMACMMHHLPVPGMMESGLLIPEKGIGTGRVRERHRHRWEWHDSMYETASASQQKD